MAKQARIKRATLHPIDRKENGHAERLASAALDRRTTTLECGVHTDGQGCTSTSTTTQAPADAPPPATPHVAVGTDVPFSRAVDDDMGDIDDGEVLDEDEQEAALRLVERLAAKLAANITDAAEWEEKEG
uniref:Uncharacterized protein n=1 Tax=Peronospora matthiolae TaxID=2874970 RepID=A0AAV1T8A0_9STRA